MALSRAHTSTKVTDPGKLLLLNKCQIKHTRCCGVWLGAQLQTQSHGISLSPI